jgi:hypothetical protein
MVAVPGVFMLSSGPWPLLLYVGPARPAITYAGIDADTPEAAAAIAAEKPTDEADNIEDCEGENLSALVDVAGDEDFSRSIDLNFEGDRIRKATPSLLAALDCVRVTLTQGVLPVLAGMDRTMKGE